MKRERMNSRIGFILVSAGCAIGIGNVWKFPYIAGQNGGGAFVLLYLLFLAIIGVPVMTMEFAIGRAAQISPVSMYRKLEKRGHKWHWHGYASVAGNYLLMMFYTTVAGWMIRYFILTLAGNFENLTSTQISAQYEKMLSEPTSMVICMGITVAAGFAVCAAGVHKGIEAVSKVIMTVLLAIMLILVINSLTLDGAEEGLEFYLKPDIARVKDVGIISVITAAMRQAFFTLSIGIGSMSIFGSYIGKERSLMGEAVNIAFLDTFVAISSGLIIFPACYTYGIEADSGPSLIFITLPNIFNSIPYGRIWGSLFFAFMTFAAFTTVIGVFENIVSCVSEITGWSRKKTCLLNSGVMFVLSLPCVFGFNLFKEIQPFGQGSTIMDLEDFIVSNIMLPLGALTVILFCVTRYGWGWKNFISEANAGKGLKLAGWMRGYMTYVLPIIVIFIFAAGLVK